MEVQDLANSMTTATTTSPAPLAEEAVSPATAQVRVAIRVRPLTSKERDCKAVVEVHTPNSIGIGARSFTYDLVLDSSVPQTTVYEQISPTLLTSFLDGYNATVMAYGQTGSGKTFTMGSEVHNSEGIAADAGLIPRFMTSIFQLLAQRKESALTNHSNDVQGLRDFQVQASFLEVYGEDVHDLLDRDRKTLPLRDDAKGGVVVTGLTSRVISSADEALDVLNQGTLNRTTAATLMNLTSSRSHAIFTIYLTQTIRSQGIDAVTTSKFTLVDLAGSERMKKTGAVGERALEGIKINEGLLALGNVINALADEERISKEKKVHVPYRQSKLTRLLQDALGGNSQTLFIACVSPAETNASETLSTLHYANRARNIKNAPTKSVDSAALELQRLQALNSLYCKELIRHKFGTDDLDTKEVKAYLQELHDSASINYPPLPMIMPPPRAEHLAQKQRHDDIPYFSSSAAFSSSGSKSIVTATPSRMNASSMDEVLDESILEEVNPEEDLAILDQLLELQAQDHEFSKKHRQSQVALKKVQGELDEQEALLLQLKESLKVYHNMKEKFQILMAEVQQLEMEKTSLVDQLQKTSVDPTKGCSLAITKKLERVEASLVRARSETRKHQQKYREAEQEAQRCKALERKITQLKQDKVAMIKKQKEATARHREFTEQKTKELLVLKKKERTAGIKVSKLQSQIQTHKNDIAKRKAYSDKVTSKLKETEGHLMRLLSLRSRELQNRNTSPGRRQSIRLPRPEDGFVRNSQELDSMKFLLNRLIIDRVTLEQTRVQYEDRVADFTEVMGKLAEEVRVLDNFVPGSDDLIEQEQVVEDLELKLEIISGDLEELRAKVGSPDDTDEESNFASKAKETIGTLSAPILRTLLLDFIDEHADMQLECQRQSLLIKKKDAVIASFEVEVGSLNQKISLLSTDLAHRRKLTSGDLDPFEIIKGLQKQLEGATKKQNQMESNSCEQEKLLTELKTHLSASQLELLECKEKLTLSETIVQQGRDVNTSQAALNVLQTLWKNVGVSSEERDKARRAIMSCLDDTCQQQISTARKLKQETELEIETLRAELTMMMKALSRSIEMDDATLPLTLFEERDQLQLKINLIKPEYENAVDRKYQIIKSTEALMSSLGISAAKLPQDLRELLGHDSRDEIVPCSGKEKRALMMKDVEDMLHALDEEESDVSKATPAMSLDSSFLDRCEKHLSNLRLEKSRRVVAMEEMRKEAHALAKEMHVNTDDIKALVVSAQPIPSWWLKDVSAPVVDMIIGGSGIVDVSLSFTQHLNHICTVLRSVSEQRKKLSVALKDVIDRAQRILLATVGEEIDASEAYQSFRMALFNLPSLSKEHIKTCVEEIDELTAGVEAMTQSEIEALTVVWEALHVTASDKADFWGEIENSSKDVGSKEMLSLASIQSEPAPEQWVSDYAKEVAVSNQILSARLHKLEKVHNEVEKLRSKQDAKSRIISLDSEISILGTSLAEFEDKCSKQRLLTKKAGSATLLEEERFRKQMQGKYKTKLRQLKVAVSAWKESDGDSFGDDVLSEDVQMILDNPDRMDSIVKKRTGFMHLRTVQSKVPVNKRANLAPISESPVAKKLRSNIVKSLSSSDSDASSSRTSEREVLAALNSNSSDGTHRQGSASIAVSRKRKQETGQVRSPNKSRVRMRKAILSHSPVAPKDVAESTTSVKTELGSSKRSSMMPFGAIFGDNSPESKDSTLR
jgi:hypothetical protein